MSITLVIACLRIALREAVYPSSDHWVRAILVQANLRREKPVSRLLDERAKRPGLKS